MPTMRGEDDENDASDNGDDKVTPTGNTSIHPRNLHSLPAIAVSNFFFSDSPFNDDDDSQKR